MSMDKLLEADKQPYVSPPMCLRMLLQEAAQARTLLEQVGNVRKESVPLVDNVSQSLGISREEASTIVDAGEKVIDKLTSAVPKYSFDIDENENNLMPLSDLAVLRVQKQERERRGNPQYRSISLRSKHYDYIDHQYLRKPLVFPDEKHEAKEVGTSMANEPQQAETAVKIEIGASPSATCQEKEIKLEQMDEYSGDQMYVPHPMPLQGRDTIYNVYTGDMTNVMPNQPLESNIKQEEDGNHYRSNQLPWGEDDLVISTSVYLGYPRQLTNSEIRLGRLMKITDRLLILGQNTLLDFKNSFKCPNDFLYYKDLSEERVTIDDISHKQLPSSFFFIHDTFYIDLLPENSIDITEPIRQWMAERPNEIGPVKVAHMDQTRLIDLTLRFGQPYVYVHQGSCEHLICFNDVALRSEESLPGPYPVRIFERNFRSITCSACTGLVAQWLIYDCDELPSSPVSVCDGCYREFFFCNGKKVMEFKAVPHIDRKAMEDTGFYLSELQKKFVAPPTKKK